jgi:MFS family permease
MFLPAFGTHGLTAGRAELAASLGLRADDWRMALLMAGFALASVVAYAVMGSFGDRRGLRRGLLLGIAAYAGAHVLLMVSAPLASFLACPSWRVFLGLRLLAGFAGGAITVSANALGAELYPPGQRGRSLSLVWLGVPLAMVVGVPLPDYLGPLWERMPDDVRRFVGEPAAAIATAAALACLATVPLLVPPAPDRQVDPGLGGAAGRAGQAGARARAPIFAFATAFLMPVGVFPLIVSAEVYAAGAFRFDPAQRGHLFVLLGASSVAGGLLSGALSDRIGRRRALLAALGSFTLLVPFLPWCGPAAYVALAAALGFVSTIRQGPFQALASYLADSGGYGRLSARVLVSSQVGIGVGQIAGIALLRVAEGGETGAAAPSLAPIVAASFTASALAWLLARRFREPATAGASP